MSFNAANDPNELYALLGLFVATGGVLAWRVKREGADPGRIVSRCSDGSVIGAWRRGVRHRRPRRRDLRAIPVASPEIAPPAPAPPTEARSAAIREDLEPGDLQFARIREAPAGESGWFVEGMDAEPEPFRIRWRFDSPDDAMAAFRLIQERILVAPVDAAGRPVSLTDREFDARWSGAGGGPHSRTLS